MQRAFAPMATTSWEATDFATTPSTEPEKKKTYNIRNDSKTSSFMVDGTCSKAASSLHAQELPSGARMLECGCSLRIPWTIATFRAICRSRLDSKAKMVCNILGERLGVLTHKKTRRMILHTCGPRVFLLSCFTLAGFRAPYFLSPAPRKPWDTKKNMSLSQHVIKHLNMIWVWINVGLVGPFCQNKVGNFGQQRELLTGP